MCVLVTGENSVYSEGRGSNIGLLVTVTVGHTVAGCVSVPSYWLRLQSGTRLRFALQFLVTGYGYSRAHGYSLR